MFFIVLLAAGALALASVSGFFSIWGLAHTFTSIFWSVIAMGVVLECAKLLAASFLYRFWTSVGWLLKTYLFAAIGVLMLVTAIGHFGFMSAGYMSDTLPNKQLQQQISSLTQEQDTLTARKQQIDNKIAEIPVDRLTARRQIVASYKSEQEHVTTRLHQIDVELSAARQNLINSEAHIGPIMYLAQSLNLPTDDVTKYLIFLIIFAFDPMAIALTLAVNIAIRQRERKSDSNEDHTDHDVVPISILDNLKPIENIDNEQERVLVSDTESVTVEDTPKIVDNKKQAINITPTTNKQLHRLYKHSKRIKNKLDRGMPTTKDEAIELQNIETFLKRSNYIPPIND